jgi:hypothetical protein
MSLKSLFINLTRVSVPRKFRVLLRLVAVVLLIVIQSPCGAQAQSACCIVRGNVDCDPTGGIDIADLSRLIDYMFISLEPLCCPESGNIDGDATGTIDIADLTRLIDFMFITFTPLVPCGTGQTLTFEQRQVLFDALDSAYNSLLGGPSDTVAIKLTAYLNTRPEIDSAGVIDSVSVWAWFTDGRIISIPNNRFPTGSGDSNGDWPDPELETSVPDGFMIPERRFPDLVDPTTEGATRQSAMVANDYDLPSSIQARVVSTLGTGCFTIGAPIIKKLLEDHGYVTVPSTGSVSSLFGVVEDGAYYIDAHGGSCRGKDGAQHLAIWTATVPTVATDSAYRTQLNRNELVYMWANDRNPANGACQVHKRYAYTGRFVAQYMYFVPNSYIFINACYSDSVASLRQGFFTAGASVFCGWTKTVTDGPANKAAEFLFDRLLGANASTLSPKESPPQRPFDADQLWTDMKNRGYDFDQSTNAQLRVQRLQNHFGLLAPSIKYMFVDESGDSLFLFGMFGSDPGPNGRVIVGGSELPILSWEPQLIRANIPNSGAGSLGPVTVEVDGLTGPTYSVKRKSNVVNLTEWRGDFTHKLVEAGSMTGTITVHAHLRADIHSFREEPHTSPFNPQVVFNAAQDSYGSAVATGTFTIVYDVGLFSTYQWSGTAFMPGLWEPVSHRLDIWGSIDPASRQMSLSLSGSTREDLLEVLTSTLFPSSSNNFSLDITDRVMDDPLNSRLHLTLTNTFDIPPGQRNATRYSPYDPFNPAAYELKWNLMQASFPPDSTAAQ